MTTKKLWEAGARLASPALGPPDFDETKEAEEAGREKNEAVLSNTSPVLLGDADAAPQPPKGPGAADSETAVSDQEQVGPEESYEDAASLRIPGAAVGDDGPRTQDKKNGDMICSSGPGREQSSDEGRRPRDQGSRQDRGKKPESENKNPSSNGAESDGDACRSKPGAIRCGENNDVSTPEVAEKLTATITTTTGTTALEETPKPQGSTPSPSQNRRGRKDRTRLLSNPIWAWTWTWTWRPAVPTRQAPASQHGWPRCMLSVPSRPSRLGALLVELLLHSPHDARQHVTQTLCSVARILFHIALLTFLFHVIVERLPALTVLICTHLLLATPALFLLRKLLLLSSSSTQPSRSGDRAWNSYEFCRERERAAAGGMVSRGEGSEAAERHDRSQDGSEDVGKTACLLSCEFWTAVAILVVLHAYWLRGRPVPAQVYALSGLVMLVAEKAVEGFLMGMKYVKSWEDVEKEK